MSEIDEDFCMYSLHTTGWEYDLYNACGEKPVRLFSTTERKRCERCGRKMMFVPEPVKPAYAIEALVKRAEKAEAEVERLKGVLALIAVVDQGCGGNLTPMEQATSAMRQARSALEAKP